MIFIDTCIVIEYLKEKAFLSKYNLDELFISDIVIMELYQGAMNKNDLAFIKKEIANFKVLNINHEIISLAKQIIERYSLSHNIKIIDAIVASTAMIYDLELMTLNFKDFRFIKQIKLVDILPKHI